MIANSFFMTFCYIIHPITNALYALYKVSLHAVLPAIMGIASLLPVNAQRISFGLYTSQEINVVPVGDGALNFSASKLPIITGSNQVVSVELMDEGVAVFEITAAEAYDLSFTIDAPTSLSNGEDYIPLVLKLAYSNQGLKDEYTARSAAVELASGFTGAIFPVVQTSHGPPGPPPTPEYAGYDTPVNTVYLYLYGSLGPVGHISTGIYEASINIHIEYAK